jgi:2-dehydropantoate 2-reductase
MSEKIAVIGAGGTGSVIGGMLTKEGYDATIIDQWPAHIEAMKDKGLELIIREEVVHIPVKAYHISEVSTFYDTFDIVFLSCKSYDTLWMVPLIGYTRDIGCVLTISSEVFEPGRVRRNTPMDKTTYTLGELTGRITPRLKALKQLLTAAGKTELTTNIWGRKWAKLVFNSMVGPLCGLGGIRPHQLTEAPERLRVGLKLGQESLQVGKALGYEMETVFQGLSMDEAFSSVEALEGILTKAVAQEGKPTCSFYHQDILKGRRTEVDFINGLISRKGDEAGISTPMNDATTQMVHRLERGEIKLDPANIKHLESYL